jgi:hypothetical protein
VPRAVVAVLGILAVLVLVWSSLLYFPGSDCARGAATSPSNTLLLGLVQGSRVKSATVSTCGVCGNMSTGLARSRR